MQVGEEPGIPVRPGSQACLPPQLLLSLALFGTCLYFMCHISVGLDQELALPKVSWALWPRPSGWQEGLQHRVGEGSVGGQPGQGQFGVQGFSFPRGPGERGSPCRTDTLSSLPMHSPRSAPPAHALPFCFPSLIPTLLGTAYPWNHTVFVLATGLFLSASRPQGSCVL